VNTDELMDAASEPHEFNIYTGTNLSTLTPDIANRLSNSFCNSTCDRLPLLYVCFAKIYLIYVA